MKIYKALIPISFNDTWEIGTYDSENNIFYSFKQRYYKLKKKPEKIKDCNDCLGLFRQGIYCPLLDFVNREIITQEQAKELCPLFLTEKYEELKNAKIEKIKRILFNRGGTTL